MYGLDGRLKNSVKNALGTENCPSDKFSYEKIIGVGAYSKVKLAVEKATGKKVAVKIYEKAKLTDPQKFKNVQREIEILKGMTHESVVQFYSHFETFRQVHIVTEYAGAQSLVEYCKRKPGQRLDPSEARQIMKQILNALIYVHSLGIVHRDIKMDNVIVDCNRRIKLIDFGFSIKLPKNAKISVFCGTPAYMAPEIVTKKQYQGEMADIWATGILFFKLVTGLYPFKGNSERELFQKISSGKFEIPAGVSSELKGLINRILKVNPSERPTAKEVLYLFFGLPIFIEEDRF